MVKAILNRESHDKEPEEIDLVELLRKVWLCRRWVVAVMVVFLFLGGVVAAVMPEEYEASCEMVPQNTSAIGQSRMSSLAALAGINLGYSERVNTLSPNVYENIISSVAFRKELLQMCLFSVRDGGYRRLDSYLLDGRRVANKPSVEYEDIYMIDVVSQRDYNCLKALEQSISLTLDDQKSCLTLSVRMPEALVAAQVAQAVMLQLQRYITEFKIENVQSNLDFVQQRYDEARHHFEQIQEQRARFRDANRNMTRFAAQTHLERLDAEYTLAMNIYNELAMQLEQAKIKVKENMPVLTVINPVSVPFKRSKPRKMIIIVTFVVIGVVVGVVGALVIPTMSAITGWAFLRRLLPEEAYESVATVANNRMH